MWTLVVDVLDSTLVFMSIVQSKIRVREVDIQLIESESSYCGLIKVTVRKERAGVRHLDSLLNDKLLHRSKLRALADDKIIVTEKKLVVERAGNIVG